MRSARAALLAPGSIRRFRLRAFVAVLSVAAGVAAMVAIQSLGAAMQQLVMGELGRLGLERLVMVHPRPALSPAAPAGTLTLRQAGELERGQQGFDCVVPVVHMDIEIQRRRAAGPTPAPRARCPTTGGSTETRMAAGRFLDETDDLTRRRVCVLGADLADRLLPGGPPAGRKVRVDGITYTVVGVLAGTGAGRRHLGRRPDPPAHRHDEELSRRGPGDPRDPRLPGARRGPFESPVRGPPRLRSLRGPQRPGGPPGDRPGPSARRGS